MSLPPATLYWERCSGRDPRLLARLLSPQESQVPLLPASLGPYVSFSISQLGPCSHCSPPLLPLSFLPTPTPLMPHVVCSSESQFNLCAPLVRGCAHPWDPSPHPLRQRGGKSRGLPFFLCPPCEEGTKDEVDPEARGASSGPSLGDTAKQTEHELLEQESGGLLAQTLQVRKQRRRLQATLPLVRHTHC